MPCRGCAGDWTAAATCTGRCSGGSGVLPEVFLVAEAAAWGGVACDFANGTLRK